MNLQVYFIMILLPLNLFSVQSQTTFDDKLDSLMQQRLIAVMNSPNDTYFNNKKLGTGPVAKDTILVIGYNNSYSNLWICNLDESEKKVYLPLLNSFGVQTLSFVNGLSFEDAKKYLTNLENSINLVRQKKDSFIRTEVKNELIKELQKKDSLVLIELKKVCSYELNTVDEFDNVKRIYTEFYNLKGKTMYGNDYVSLQLRTVGSSKYVVFKSTSSLGCASPYLGKQSQAKVKLKNGQVVTFNHRGSLDCKDFRLVGLLTNSDVNSLMKSEIKTIRLSGTESYQDMEINEFNDFFINKLDCIK